MVFKAILYNTDMHHTDDYIGAVLEEDGHPVAYESRALKKAEQNYSVIQ